MNVYGGFYGSETSLSQRMAKPYLTIISRDENGDGGFRLLNSSELNAATTWVDFTFVGENIGSGVSRAIIS